MTVGIDDDAVINNIILTNQSSTPTTPGAGKTRIFTKADGLHFVNSNGYDSFVGLFSVCNGRITLTSGTAVTTSDVTAATSLWFVQYKGNQIGLYNGTSWDIIQFNATALSLVGTTGSVNYDVFAYNNAGTLALELGAWSNDTTRSTALTFQDGIYVKSGTSTRRYLGTIRASANGQCEDSDANRFVWNYHNRVERRNYKTDATNHAYTTEAWRYWNNDSTQNLKFVIGVAEDISALMLTVYKDGITYLGFDDDAATAGDIALGYIFESLDTDNIYRNIGVSSTKIFAAGYHFLSVLEYGGTNGTFIDFRAHRTFWG